MQATVLDLRYKMNNVLKALKRNEAVTILYHGKTVGTIIPASHTIKCKAKDHPLFGIREKTDDVTAIMDNLRGSRYHDL